MGNEFTRIMAEKIKQTRGFSMGKYQALKRLARFKLYKTGKATKAAAKPIAVAGGITLTGSVSGRQAAGWTASANDRDAAKQEGWRVGTVYGAGAAAINIVFRRIGGRIVPIRVKK